MLEAYIRSLKDNNAGLTMLDLSNHNRDADDAQAIAEDLKHNTSLIRLYLTENNIGDAGAQYIAEALKRNKSLVTLDLYDNSINPVGAIALAEALKTNTSLTMLDLSNNNIGDAGAKDIADALKINTSLIKLYLALNNISDDGAKEIAEALEINTSLTMLDLSNNNIGPVGAQYIAEALKRNKSLTELSLLGSKNIGPVGAKTLDEAIKNNEYICYAQYENQSQEIKDLLFERQDNIHQLIKKYRAGKPDMEKITKFSKQIEYFSIAYQRFTGEELLKLKQDIVAYVSNKLVKKLPSLIPDVADCIINYLDFHTITQINIACDNNLYVIMQIKQEAELKMQQLEAALKAEPRALGI
jgi:Ran GTPase-activating protein (RanGAP) involved in mRNA processing and transport